MPASESHAAAADGSPATPGGQVPADPATSPAAGQEASAAAGHDAATRHGLMFVLYGSAFAVYLLDRLTKTLVAHNFHEPTTLIPGVLQLKYTENSGGAFGVFDGAVWLFLVATIVVVGVIIYASFNLPNRIIAVALGLVLAGAIGNLTDRAVRGTTFFGGHVVDFLAFAKSPTAQPVWPVFNVADSAIVCGAVLILYASISKTTHHR